MPNFDKSLLGKNIRFLANKNGIKVGDIENEANVSTGYLSRLANEDNKNSFPIMDLLFLISKKFDVSINTLLSVDFSSLTPNEILLSQFFDKLNKDTENNKIIWELDSKEKLEAFNSKKSKAGSMLKAFGTGAGSMVRSASRSLGTSEAFEDF